MARVSYRRNILFFLVFPFSTGLGLPASKKARESTGLVNGNKIQVSVNLCYIFHVLTSFMIHNALKIATIIYSNEN